MTKCFVFCRRKLSCKLLENRIQLSNKTWNLWNFNFSSEKTLLFGISSYIFLSQWCLPHVCLKQSSFTFFTLAVTPPLSNLSAKLSGVLSDWGPPRKLWMKSSLRQLLLGGDELGEIHPYQKERFNTGMLKNMCGHYSVITSFKGQ